MKVKGDLQRDGEPVISGVEFSIITQESNGFRQTSGSFELPRNVSLDWNDPAFDVELIDGRTGRISISGRVAHGNVQHFSFRAVGLK